MKKIYAGGIIVLILLVAVLTYFSFANKTSGNVVSNSDEARIIEINASKFKYSVDTITVKKGEHVKIVINNVDTKHGMVIPDLGVSGIDSVEFTADEAGTYEFNCPTPCGSGHRNMKGTLIVEE